MSTACAVLAAGRSARLGSPKQLLFIAGEPLVRRAVAAACASRCEHVAVVLGAEAPAIAAALGHSRATTLLNARWSVGGLASTIHVAVHWARALSASALLLSVCDQPHLDAAHLNALLDAHARERRSVASRYRGTLGVPALLDARLFEALLALTGDRGAARLLRSGLDVGAVDWPEGAVDLDTEVDVARFRAGRR